MINPLHTYQNSDGGWPYRPGGSSWTEPTVFALLAGYATGNLTGRARALDWLRRMQRIDGGWTPKPGVDQSTWVTALVALLPPADLGSAAHFRAIRWLLDQTPANATLSYRLRAWLDHTDAGESERGWSWLPGTAAWATPTAIATLALNQECRRNPSALLNDRITSARKFLLAHRCADGGWNHGAAKALGFDAESYPETTGAALLAVAALDHNSIAPSIARAEAWWNNCPSCEAASWLMLGLRAAGRAKAVPPPALKSRTIQDAALFTLAVAGDRGTQVFLP